MTKQFLHSDHAIDLLAGNVERSRPQIRAASYGRTANGTQRPALCKTKSITELQSQTDCHSRLERSQNTWLIQQKNSGKRYADLSGNSVLSRISKELAYHHPATNFGTFPALISGSSTQEKVAVNGKSAHHRFSKIPSRQGVPFFAPPRPAGESPSGKTRGCKQLVMLSMNYEITTLGVQD